MWIEYEQRRKSEWKWCCSWVFNCQTLNKSAKAPTQTLQKRCWALAPLSMVRRSRRATTSTLSAVSGLLPLTLSTLTPVFLLYFFCISSVFLLHFCCFSSVFLLYFFDCSIRFLTFPWVNSLLYFRLLDKLQLFKAKNYFQSGRTRGHTRSRGGAMWVLSSELRY